MEKVNRYTSKSLIINQVLLKKNCVIIEGCGNYDESQRSQGLISGLVVLL